MFKTRLITGLILGVSFIAAILLLDPLWLAVVFAILIVIGAFEWAKLSDVKQPAYRVAYSAIFILLMYYGWKFVNNSPSVIPLMITAACWWLLAFLWVMSYPIGNQKNITNISVKLFSGVLILLPAWVGLVYLHQAHSAQWVLYIMVLIWVADSGAYIAGKIWGKRKLAPKVSPGKSWEGVFGAIAACTVYAVVGVWWLDIKTQSMILFVVLSILIVPVSVLGDLFESMVKRHSGHKDSSNILPGHGGIMDRIDSLTAAVPLFVLGVVGLGIQQ